jgi:hypothetical protein
MTPATRFYICIAFIGFALIGEGMMWLIETAAMAGNQ